MENKEILLEEQDNRFEDVTFTKEHNDNIVMDDENPWFIIASNTGVA